MQQYFVKGSAISPVTIEDKETSKHMFQVMRLKEDDEVTLVFDVASTFGACSGCGRLVSLNWSKN